MTDVSTIGQGSDYAAFIKGLTPEQMAEGIAQLSSYSTIQKSEQDQIEELLALLPKPQLDPATFITLSQNMGNNFGINAIASNLTGLKTGQGQNLGSTEGAIVLAGLVGWMKSQEQSTQSAQDVIQSQDNNPITIALKAYVEGGATSGTLNVQDVQLLRNAPVLLAAIKAQDVDLVSQAFQIAEQQVVLAMLNQWSQYEQQRAETQREDEKTKEKTQLSPNQQMFQDFLEGLKNGSIPISMTTVSALIANLTPGAREDTDSTKEALQPIFNVTANLPNIQAIPSDLQGRFTFALNAYTTLAQYWSMPGAMSMVLLETNPSDETITKAAVNSYAITLAQFVLSPDFEKLVTQVARKNQGEMPDDHLQSFIAALRVCLLSSALAALEKTETGRFIGKSIQALIEGKVTPQNDLQLALIKYIRNDKNNIFSELQDPVFNALYAYFDQSPSLGRLIDPSKAFVALWDPRFFHETSLAKSA